MAACRMQDAGLTPDVLIKQTARDVAAGRDAVMEAALTRLKAA